MGVNSIYTVSDQSISLFQSQVFNSITKQNKIILTIALAAFACLAVCYALVYSGNLKWGGLKSDDQEPGIGQKSVSDNLAPMDDKQQIDAVDPMKLFSEAMELMFSDRKLKWGEHFDQPTLEQEKKRHNQLKQVIRNLSSDSINRMISYRDGMTSRTQTLLLQAIMEIKDPDRRLEIVELLLEKGADPEVEGFYYDSVPPLHKAEETKDDKLISRIKEAIRAKSDTSVSGVKI